MPRYTSPPPDFQCLYEHNCPYLKELSTKWVWETYERADSQYQEHLRIIDEYDKELENSRKRILSLEQENAEMKAKLQAVHRRQFKSNKKKDKQKREKTSANINRSKKKKRGVPTGHPGWFRPKPKHVDQIVLLMLLIAVLIVNQRS